MVAKVVKFPSAVQAERSRLELESRTSRFSPVDHVELQLVVAVPAPAGRQEARHTYRAVAGLKILRRNREEPHPNKR